MSHAAAADRAPAVSASGVVCRFGPLTALDRVDLDAPPGRVTVILGPNGAGKTTLLRVLATLVRPAAGTVWVAGADALRAPAAVRARIGVVLHRPLLYPDLTVAENLGFFARLYGLDDPRARTAAALDAAELTAHRDRPVRTLSRGMAQRAAIARAGLHDPSVLLLDEPYAGLDPRAADRLDGALAAHAAAGRAVVVTLHDLERAAALAGPLVVLRRGAVAWAGEGGGIDRVGLRAIYERAERGESMPVTGPWAHIAAPATAPDCGRSPAAARGAPFAAAVGEIVRKDVRVELRAREAVLPVGVFALLAIVVFQFSLPRDPASGMLMGAPGAIWIALLFGSSLGLTRALGAEIDGGGMTGLRLAPVDPGAIFVGKWLAGYAFGLAVAAILVPACVVWLNLAPAAVPALMGCVALGLAGWTAAGTLMAAVAAGTRAREVLLPLVLFPAVLPLLIPAVQATTALLGLDDGGTAVWPLLALMAACDAVFIVLGFLLFPIVVEG